MTSVDETISPVLPGSAAFTDLLAEIRAGAKDRDLNDENPFAAVTALKRAGFGTLRLPENLGGSDFTVPQLFSTVDDPISGQWLRKVAGGTIFGDAFSENLLHGTAVPANAYL